MKNIHIILILIFGLFISCKTDKKDDSQKGEVTTEKKIDKSKLLFGRWKTSTFINEAQLKKIFEEDMEEGMSGVMTIDYEYQFIKGNRYNGEGEMNLKFKMDGQELPLSFYYSESGTWNLHDNTLVTISEDAKMIALDDFTKNLLAISPEIKQMLQPNKGEATSVEIVLLSEKILKVTDEELPGVTFTYNKK